MPETVPTTETVTTIDVPTADAVIESVVSGSPWVMPITGDDKPVPAHRHTGRYTNLGIEQFQNWLYARNAERWTTVTADGSRAVVGLSDYQIAILWAVEFPNARCDYMRHVDYVASTRTAYVNNRHPHGCGNHPDHDITFDVNGNPAKRPYRGPAR